MTAGNQGFYPFSQPNKGLVFADLPVGSIPNRLMVQATIPGSANILAPGATADGYTMVIGDRIFLFGQTVGSQNGIWIFNGANVPLTRPVDYASSSATLAFYGLTVYIIGGNVFTGLTYRITTTGTIVIDTTSTAWAVVPANLSLGGAIKNLALANGGTSSDLHLTGGAGQYVKQSGSGFAFSVGTIAAADLPAVAVSPLTTKGDLHGFDTVDNRIGVGANGSMLIANSGNALGVNWANNPTITGGTIDNAVIGGTTPAAATFNGITLNAAGPYSVQYRKSGVQKGDVALSNAAGQYDANAVLNDMVMRSASGNFLFNTDNGVNTQLWLRNGGRISIRTGGASSGAGYAAGGMSSLGGSIFDHFADVGNATSAETDLITDTLPASTLGTNGDTFHAVYFGQYGATANNKTIKTYFAGTVIQTGTTVALNTGTWWIEVFVTRDSSTSVRCLVQSQWGTGTSPQITYTAISGLTLSNSQIAKITGTGVANNDIVSKVGKILWKSAA